tara:strand:- start:2180 stop:2341 length:162 start_codon:yes stop_codon:yes gene_type:complete
MTKIKPGIFWMAMRILTLSYCRVDHFWLFNFRRFNGQDCAGMFKIHAMRFADY